MRVISQWKDIDIDYESSSFIIDKADTEENEQEQYTIIGMPQGTDLKFAMASYSTIEKAKEAMQGMANNYVRYLITDLDNHMTMTDAIDCQLDTPFNKIEIKELKATIYQFPEEV